MSYNFDGNWNFKYEIQLIISTVHISDLDKLNLVQLKIEA